MRVRFILEANFGDDPLLSPCLNILSDMFFMRNDVPKFEETFSETLQRDM